MPTNNYNSVRTFEGQSKQSSRHNFENKSSERLGVKYSELKEKYNKVTVKYKKCMLENQQLMEVIRLKDKQITELLTE